MAAGRTVALLLAGVALGVVIGVAAGHNITAILADDPDYSLYNAYLTRTRLSDEINSLGTVTCLVLSNAAMSGVITFDGGAKNATLAAIKNALRMLTLLDYLDEQKLRNLPGGTAVSTSLYQTTGLAIGSSGNVNITVLAGDGKQVIAFAATVPDAKLESSILTKSVRQLPYNMSVLEVSAPIVFRGLLSTPSIAAGNDVTALLERAGCKRFAALIVSTGLLSKFLSVMSGGLTVFAPTDGAFSAAAVANLTGGDLATVLEYHAMKVYMPKASLAIANEKLKTLASDTNGDDDYLLQVMTRGDDVSLVTGVDTSRVISTVADDVPVCVMAVDRVLLPPQISRPGAHALAPSVPAASTSSPASAPASSPKSSNAGAGYAAALMNGRSLAWMTVLGVVCAFLGAGL